MRLKLITFFILANFISEAEDPFKADLDNFIVTIIQQYKLPGLSIAIVKDDSIFYTKGFGVKKLGEPDLINEHTIFEVASITKSFTATLIGILVDRGKIKWTDPVVKYIPEFETNEPYITKNLTIQDLLALRSGILDGDNLRSATRLELIPLIKNLKVSESFRLSQTSYNLNYSLLGLIAEIITGNNWEEMVKNEILSPLKMTETFTDISSALASKNISVPHRVENGNNIPIEWKDFGVISPAAGIYSNVMDLAKWIRLQLNKGIVDNIPVIRPESLDKMQSPQTITLNQFKSYFNPEATVFAIGFGWFISDYKGLKVVQMGGLWTGTSNLITMIPSKKIGIVIQSNVANAFNSFLPINYKIINILTGS